jgi:cell division protein ZipA
LLVLGAVIVIGVYGYTRFQRWRREGPPWRSAGRKTPREPFAGDADPLMDDPLDGAVVGPARVVSTSDDETPAAEPAAASPEVPNAEPAPNGAPSTAPAPEPIMEDAPAPGEVAGQTPAPTHEPTVEEPELPLGEPPADADEPPPVERDGEEKIVALTVMAPRNTPFQLTDLAANLEKRGLHASPQGVFQRGVVTGHGRAPLFTVANVVEPGTFDLDAPESATTPGAVFIIQLPGPFDGLSAFEQMLELARAVSADLGGQLLDGRRCDLTRQAIEHIREELREYRRRAHLARRRLG